MRERPTGSGEIAGAARRRRLLALLGALMAVGFAAGFGTAFAEDRATGAIPPGWAIAMVAVSIAAIGYGSWRYFRMTDELDLRDNLIAAAAGLMVYQLLYPAWYVLWKADVVGEPDGPAIFLTTLAATMLVYGWKKLRP